METWYKKVRDDLTLLPEFLEYYQNEYEEAKKEVKLSGSGSLQNAAAAIPHVVEHRFAQLQDIEAVLKHLNIQYEKIRSEVFQKWFENQKAARALTARDAEKYVDSDQMVNEMAELINEVAFIRNLYLSIHKGLDNKSYQINNITKLKAAGLDDAKI